MKPATPRRGGLLSHLPSVFTMSLGVATFGSPGQAIAESVDSELVLLVDISQPGLNNKDFSSLMGSYASSFSSAEVLNSIQSGTYGRIAVSLMFFGDSGTQQVGIPWMSIGTAAEASQFASLLGGMSSPKSSGSVDLAAGMNAAVASFGTETGGADNGFESAFQYVDITATNAPKGSAQATSAARDSALASGVDLINTIAVGKKTDQIVTYYADNVIGSGLSGVTPRASSSDLGGALAIALTSEVSTTLGTSVTAIPEPSALIGLSGICLILFRRRRG